MLFLLTYIEVEANFVVRFTVLIGTNVSHKQTLKPDLFYEWALSKTRMLIIWVLTPVLPKFEVVSSIQSSWKPKQHL